MRIKDSNLRLALKNLFQSIKPGFAVIEPHLGLGDSIICLGLIRSIAAHNPLVKFYYAVLPSSYHSVSWMLKDINNIYVQVVQNGRQARQFADFLKATYIPIGIKNVDIKNFDAFFYKQHNISFEERWTQCNVSPGPKSEELFSKLNADLAPYILVCDSDSGKNTYELQLDNVHQKKIIRVRPLTNNIFDWTKLAINADEIHTVDTGFIHFIESLIRPNTPQLLYFHRARISQTEFTRRLPWVIKEYF